MGPIKIHSPVKGDWSFMNPPGHHPDAKDIVAVNSKGLPYNGTNTLRHIGSTLDVTETFAWEQEIFSPFEGTVIKVADTAQDKLKINLFRDLIKGLVIAPNTGRNGIESFLGNYVTIKSGDGVHSLFAHLRQESVVVNEGEKIVVGQLIGRVGNSGNTILPHLHFQLMMQNNPSQATPIPFVFNCCHVRNKGAWEPASSMLPGNFVRFRV